MVWAWTSAVRTALRDVHDDERIKTSQRRHGRHATLCKRSLAAKTRSSSLAAIFSSLPSPLLQFICADAHEPSEGERAQYGARLTKKLTIEGEAERTTRVHRKDNGVRVDTSEPFAQRRTTASTRATDRSRAAQPCSCGARRARAPLASQHARRRPHPRDSARRATLPHPPTCASPFPARCHLSAQHPLLARRGTTLAKWPRERLGFGNRVRFRLLSLFSFLLPRFVYVSRSVAEGTLGGTGAFEGA